jgi:hypothetical protein
MPSLAPGRAEGSRARESGTAGSRGRRLIARKFDLLFITAKEEQGFEEALDALDCDPG